ncbi:hypothetical protein J6590_006990 [Homalodisca vitripennis]|nr:hypothetical protein J6590_006990 [Homalodisca vitripennis]
MLVGIREFVSTEQKPKVTNKNCYHSLSVEAQAVDCVTRGNVWPLTSQAVYVYVYVHVCTLEVRRRHRAFCQHFRAENPSTSLLDYDFTRFVFV